ncbi:LysR family transcriptional regulator [Sorangium sp. So ce296]|uniref:LysR family transcriptional regulator n=1 Tax=Sorangium sp. So ce296 TaxID=3133296 RepID=UPI000AAE6377
MHESSIHSCAGGTIEGYNRPVIDLNEMVCFAHVVDQGSFAAAARRLRIPPSTMSRTIAALERRLGARLLERTTRKLRLTDAGAQYHERCRRIVAEAEEADRLMAARASRAQGTVRVSVPEAFVERLLAPAVTRLLATYPDVRVECLTDDRYVDLVGERIDVALRVLSPRDRSAQGARRLGETSPVLCASPAYLEARGAPRAPEGLSSHALCAFGRDRSAFSLRLVDRAGRAVRVRAVPRLLTTSDAHLRSACLGAAGIALLPPFVVDADLRAGRLVRVLPRWTGPALRLFAVTPSARAVPAHVRVFLDLLYEHVSQHPRLLDAAA